MPTIIQRHGLVFEQQDFTITDNESFALADAAVSVGVVGQDTFALSEAVAALSATVPGSDTFTLADLGTAFNQIADADLFIMREGLGGTFIRSHERFTFSERAASADRTEPDDPLVLVRLAARGSRGAVRRRVGLVASRPGVVIAPRF